MINISKKAFLAIFLPILFQQFAQTLMGSLDTMLLSALSDGAVAATGIANQILVIGTMILNIVPMGASIILNQLFYSDDESKKGRIIANMMGLNLCFSIVVFIFIYFKANFLLSLLQTPNGLVTMGKDYLIIVGFSLVFQSILSNFGVVFRSKSLVKTVMFISLLSNVLNAFANALVIFTPLTLLGKGVIGVANATLLTRILSVLIYVFIYFKTFGSIMSKYLFPRFNVSEIKMIMRLGVPSMLESISYNISSTILTGMIATLGVAVLTGRIYTIMLTNFIFMVSIAWSMSVQLLVARRIGVDDKSGAHIEGNHHFKYAVVVVSILMFGLALSSPFITSILTKRLDIRFLVVILVTMSIFLEPLRCGNSILIANLNATGEVRFPFLLGVIVTYLITIPMSYLSIFVFNFNIYGIWAVMIIDEGLRVMILKKYWDSGKWKQKLSVMHT